MEIPIIVILLILLLSIWVISTQRRLTVMSENVESAMNQIGVQLSSRYDMLVATLNQAADYDAHMACNLIAKVNFHRCVITSGSTTGEIMEQEKMIQSVLDEMEKLVRQHPDIKENDNYRKFIEAVDSYGRMLQTSTLIYNDSVTKFNRAVCMMPTKLIAGIMGFQQCSYLENIR